MWADPQTRRAAIAGIGAGSGSSGGHGPADQVDAAVRAALRLHDLPRPRLAGVDVAEHGRGWIARKVASCMMLVDTRELRAFLATPGEEDTPFKSWVHESVHARAPFAHTAPAEAREYPGYEEGFAETLAQWLVGTAGITAVRGSFPAYVAAYKALAEALAVDPELIWRRLWTVPPGRVRDSFPDAVSAVLAGASGGEQSDAVDPALIRREADLMFRWQRARDRSADRAILRDRWVRALHPRH